MSDPYQAAPGWPAVLAAVYAPFGHHYGGVRVVQALLGGVLVLAVAGTGALFFTRRAGVLAGLATALYPPLIYLSAVLYAEHLAAVLIAATTWSLAFWHQHRSYSRLVVAGLLLGAAALESCSEPAAATGSGYSAPAPHLLTMGQV